MIREHLFHKKAATDEMFRWRGGDISRIEGLSDGVFALTLTMLVIRSDAPQTYTDLRDTVVELPVFLACFAMLMMAWRYHYLFFRRYGLEDFTTSLLNAAYLFLVLFLAFPLKFLATFLYDLARRQDVTAMFPATEGLPLLDQRCGMMQFYGAALIGVFGVQALLLLWAWVQRERLELDRLERFLTLSSISAHVITCLIAGASILVVSVWQNPGLAGVTYFLMPFAHFTHGFWAGRHASMLRRALDQPA